MHKLGRCSGLAAVAVATMVGCAKQPAPAAVPAPAPAANAPARQGPPPAQQQGGMPDSVQALNDRYVAQVTASIAGRENLPAEQVFKDIQVLKGTPAGRLVAIMNTGYSRALGVSCAQCHDVSDYAANVKNDKKTARGMVRMVNMINEGNRNIPEFAGDPPIVNCTVCHRGSRRPMRNLPGQGARPGGQQPAPRTGD